MTTKEIHLSNDIKELSKEAKRLSKLRWSLESGELDDLYSRGEKDHWISLLTSKLDTVFICINSLKKDLV